MSLRLVYVCVVLGFALCRQASVRWDVDCTVSALPVTWVVSDNDGWTTVLASSELVWHVSNVACKPIQAPNYVEIQVAGFIQKGETEKECEDVLLDQVITAADTATVHG